MHVLNVRTSVVCSSSEHQGALLYISTAYQPQQLKQEAVLLGVLEVRQLNVIQ